MQIKGIIDEDFINYKLTSMFIIMPYCSMKCDKENGTNYCYNSSLLDKPIIDIPNNRLIKRFMDNEISKAIVFLGLEPLDTFEDLFSFIQEFRKKSEADVVIYTLYEKDEIKDKIEQLKQYKNIVMKFGRYRPNQEKHYDNVLGVHLASYNQFAERVS